MNRLALRSACVLSLLIGSSACAQVVRDADPTGELAPARPEPAADLLSYVNAAYWSPEERTRLRVEHGLWEPEELTTPALTARAMLLAGRPNHGSLSVPLAGPLDRAEAMIERGELRDALKALEGTNTIRAHRLRAETLELLGDYEQADLAVDPVVDALLTDTLDDAGELVDGVLALMVRSRLRGPSKPGDPGSAAADFRTLMQLLARARDELDRQSWQAHAVEAELLYERGNLPQAAQAAGDALVRNPRAARVWRLLGTMAVDRFSFDKAMAIADVMDGLADGPSPDAELLRARAALRQNDVAGALERIEQVLIELPTHPRGLALHAAAVASTFDEAALQAALDEFDARTGTPPLAPHHAHLAVGMRLGEARQYEPAAAHLREAIKRQPNLAQSWSELGLLSMQAGKDDEALDSLREAARLDPFHTQAVNSLALIEDLVNWPTLESAHFIVRYRAGIDELLAREMLPVLEAIHTRVTGPEGFDHEPTQPTIIELMPDHATFAVRITGMPALHTVAAATGPAIAMESPQEGPGFTTGTYDWPRVLEHEYAHTVTLSRTRNRIPHWFTEAAAVWMENSPRPWNWWQLLASAYESGTLFKMNEISLRFVRPIKPSDRTQAYAQGHWMYEYMVHAHGGRAPLELMDLYAQGVAQDEAMQRVLGIGEDEFFADFLQWAGDELRAAGLRGAAEEPTLEELAAKAGIDLGEHPSTWEPGVLAKWLDEHPEHPEVLKAAAVAALANKGDKPLALSPELVPLLERLARARPVDPLAHRELARLALTGELEGARADSIAIEHLEFLDRSQTSTPVYARALVDRYAKLGDLERAWLRADRAVNIAPFDPALREVAATVAVQAQRWDDAERMLEALAKLEPDRPIHARRLEALRTLRAGG